MEDFYLIFLTSKAEIFLSILLKVTHIIRCKLMGRLCFLLALCSVIEFYKRFFLAFVGFLVMDCASCLEVLVTNYNDFGYGVLVFGRFSRFFNVLVLLFMFILGFRFLKFKGKSIYVNRRNGVLKSFRMVGSNDGYDDFHGVVELKNSSFECGDNNVNRVLGKSCGDLIFEENNEVLRLNSSVLKEEVEFSSDEDEMFDVMSLRKMVKAERRKANAAQNELEKERMATSSSVDEAMAMILRLQNEKSALQMQVKQLERVAEEKEYHDQEVIESLRWVIMEHESERNLLEDQVRFCKEKLRKFIKGEEWDEFECVCPTPSASHSSFWDSGNDVMIRELDFDS